MSHEPSLSSHESAIAQWWSVQLLLGELGISFSEYACAITE